MVETQPEGTQYRSTLAESWVARLDGRRPRVAFADGDDERVRAAAHELVGLGIRTVLVSDSSPARPPRASTCSDWTSSQGPGWSGGPRRPA